MAERIVQEESLVAVADAIRAKGGTTDPLSFPTGFADAISAIQAGGSDGGAIIEEGQFTPEADIPEISIFSERFKQTLKLPKYMIVRPIVPDGTIKDMTGAFLFVVNYFPVDIQSSGHTKITYDVYACGYSKTYSQEAANYVNYDYYLSASDKQNGLLYLFNNIQMLFKASTTYKWTAIW